MVITIFMAFALVKTYDGRVAPRGASRAAAISTTADLMRRQGYGATGLDEILRASGSPKGSFYFHFPAGKEQLAAEALDEAGRGVRTFIDAVVAAAATPGDAVRRIAAVEARQLAASGFELGCPIATVTLEMAARSDAIQAVAQAAYDSWAEPVAALLAAHDVTPTEAALLARWVIAALEGALVLARAARDETIVTSLGDVTADALDDRLASRPTRRT
jgi:TetR/AcrR family transcriptional repressor of lmrAB and yxaGH operons